MANLWYLSPSNQTDNIGLGSYGSEQKQMYLLADAITPHLDRCGVSFHVADRTLSLQQKRDESNAMGAAWYLALHSNAGGNGQAWGPIAFYGTAETFARKLIQELLATGQQNNRSENVTKTTSLYEVVQPAAKACLLEVDFHDSEVGVDFIMNKRAVAARAIAKAIVETDGKQWVESSDDGASAWAKEYTEQAKAMGLFSGDSNGGYRWQDYLTREEAAAVLLRMKAVLEQMMGGA